MRQTAYLDYNATVPIRTKVIEAVASAMAGVGNPSSVHGPGRSARAVVEKARVSVAGLVGVRPRDIIFTSGGTEANNALRVRSLNHHHAAPNGANRRQPTHVV